VRRVRAKRLRQHLSLAGAGGQVAVLLVGGLLAVVTGALVLGAVARGMGVADGAQRAADLSALAAAGAMHAAYPRLFEPAVVDGEANPRHLEKAVYLALGRGMAARVAAANGAPDPAIAFPDAGTIAPVRVRVTAHRRIAAVGKVLHLSADAEAELAPSGATGAPAFGAGGGYDGPLAYRQGKPMRPDVAQAFDRMAASARRDGVDLIVTSGFRSDAEQAILFARHPDPKMGRPAGRVAASQRDRARPRTEVGLWLARRTRREVPLPPALRVGAVALRLHVEPALVAARRLERGRVRGR
jgi:hypothetical protein